MNKVSQRSARYFYLLMKVLSNDRDKLTVKMTKNTHLYILGNAHVDEDQFEAHKKAIDINGVNIIFDDHMHHHLVIMDVKERDAFNTYHIEIL